MKIIKQGKPELQIKPSKQNTISCLECGCVFQYCDYDTHFGDLIYDNGMYVRCPWCGHEIKEYF